MQHKVFSLTAVVIGVGFCSLACANGLPGASHAPNTPRASAADSAIQVNRGQARDGFGLPINSSAAPDVEYHFFAPVPYAIQRSDSGITFGAGLLHQHYVESQGGKTLGSERGNIMVYHGGIAAQGDHWDGYINVLYANGTDDYDGAIQSCTSGQNGPVCTTTPARGRTGNNLLDFEVGGGWGFSPMAHFAIIPEVFFGNRTWNRHVGGPTPFVEKYTTLYYGAGLKMRYAISKVTLGVEGRYGRTFDPKMQASLVPGQFDLGSAPMYSVGAKISWQPLSWLGVYLKDTYGSYSFGQSGAMDLGGGLTATEPRSRTQQNVVMVGIKLM